MGKIENVELQSYSEWSTATYIDDDGEEYEIRISKTYDANMGYEHKELVNMEKDGNEIDYDNPIWKKIQKHISKGGYETSKKFKVGVS